MGLRAAGAGGSECASADSSATPDTIKATVSVRVAHEVSKLQGACRKYNEVAVSLERFHLFLDFDGVLVTKFSKPSERYEGMEFDPACTETLGEVLQFLRGRFDEFVVVIISNWRLELSERKLIGRLQEHDNIQRYVSGIEVLGKQGDKRAALAAYIEQGRLSARRYIILDDEDLGDELRPMQIRTRSEDGIRDVGGMLYAIKEVLTL